MITGVNHINLSVKDVDVSFRFYKEILGFTPLCKSEGSAYFLAGTPGELGCLWVALDFDRKKVRVPSPCHSHVAFSVSAEDFEKMSSRIIASGAKVFKENTSPGDSLYFLDPDGHKFEIHVGNWRTRIEAKKLHPSGWKNVEWFV